MTDELLYQSALRVIEDVQTAMFRPTGEIRMLVEGRGAEIGREGTAPPPVLDFLRCVDYYTAVHARHHTNYPVLKKYVHEVLQEALRQFWEDQGVQDPRLTLDKWCLTTSCNPEAVERVLHIGLLVLSKHRTEGG